jgi:two-component system chemotaxis response regulator CheB
VTGAGDSVGRERQTGREMQNTRAHRGDQHLDSSAPRGPDIVVVGASAGGVEALTRLVAGLPPALPAALFVVLHMPLDARSMLPAILARAGPLPAAAATDGESIAHARISVAPPNHHLLLEPGRVRVLIGPTENGVRPAVDPLVRSAAHAYGPRVAGVVLSGALDDGTAGLQTIQRLGGTTIVQDPADALVPGMPGSALAQVAVDHCLPAAEIGPLLARLATMPARPSAVLPHAGARAYYQIPPPPWTARAPREEGAPMTAHGQQAWPPEKGVKQEGNASGYSCPDCDGSLWEARDDGVVRFECRIGHRYTLESLLSLQGRRLEDAIWVAINALEERAALLRKQSLRVGQRGHNALEARFAAQAEEMEDHAETIRRTLLGLVRSFSAGAEPDAVGGADEAPRGSPPAPPGAR